MYKEKIEAIITWLIVVGIFMVLFWDMPLVAVICSGVGAIIIETAMVILEKLEEDFNMD